MISEYEKGITPYITTAKNPHRWHPHKKRIPAQQIPDYQYRDRIYMKLDIVLEKEEDGRYSAHCPALKGCHSQGRTREKALKNMQEAIDLYHETSKDIASHH